MAVEKIEEPKEKSKAKKTSTRKSTGRKSKSSKIQIRIPALLPENESWMSNLPTGEGLKIIPLGGLNEIGKNLTVFECGDEIVLIDCGLAFPDSEMLGVDIVIPDFTYLERNKDKIKALLLTHGHEDHIGGVAYLLKKFNIPVYGSRLTLGLLANKLKEHSLGNAKLIAVKAGQTIKLGVMSAEFITVNHSIPDSTSIALKTPYGTVIHTGDFKVDYTPINGNVIDLARFAELGKKGVLALLMDSTNVERQGYTPSEHKVGENFKNLFVRAGNKRIIIATFSSNIHRIQQVMDLAKEFGRKVAVFGRSMEASVNTAIELGYLNVPKSTIIPIEDLNKYPSEKTILITTGSQGEPMSALTRMAGGDHKKVAILPTDFIIISANPIPGNEKSVTKVINELLKSGAEVISDAIYEVHVSGHACQEELKLMMNLVKPKYFIPVHGEYKHLKRHAQLAVEVGISKENIIIASIGNVIETDGKKIGITGTVPAGKTLVDGLGVGDVGSVVLRDRQHLSRDGLIIVVIAMDYKNGVVINGPEIISRGFVYVRESEELLSDAKETLDTLLAGLNSTELHNRNLIKSRILDKLSSFISERTGRSPMILPITIDV
jgi:ribonuclease J